MKDVYKIRMNEFCDILNRSISVNLASNLNVSRPKCSISPINNSITNDSTSIFIQPIHSIRNNESDPKLFQNDSFLNQYSSTIDQINNQTKNLYGNSNISQDSGFQCYENSLLSSSPFCSANDSKINDWRNQNMLSIPNNNFHLQSTPNKTILNYNIQSNNLSLKNYSKPKSRINFHSISDLAISSSNILPQHQGEMPLKKQEYYNNSNLTTFQSSSKLSFNEQLRIMSVSISNKENSHDDFFNKSKRKTRTHICKRQREILEYAYQLKNYPDSTEVEYLCNILGFEENVIRIWFQNKRAREKVRH